MKRLVYLPLVPLLLTAESVDLGSIGVESEKGQKSPDNDGVTADTLSEEKLEETKTKDIRELSALIPNTNISGIGNKNNTTVTMRGISNYVVYESSVAVYVDDVPLPFSYGMGLIDMKNIESLEILKGPQGTLFGTNAEAGVINIYTKSPSDRKKIELEAGYASYDTREFGLFLSGPVQNDRFGYSISLDKKSSNGYATGIESGEPVDTLDLLSFDGKLLYRYDSEWGITLGYSITDDRQGGTAYKVNTTDDPFRVADDPVRNFLDMQTDRLFLTVRHEDSDSQLSSVSSFSRQSILETDYIGVVGGVRLDRDIDIGEFYQELKYKQRFENGDLTAGVSYSHKTGFDYKETQTLLTLFDTPLSSCNLLDNPDENFGFFSQYRYYLGEKFSVMGGLRYQQTRRSLTQEFSDFGAAPIHASGSTTWSHLLPTVSLSWYPDSDSHLYLTYSQGYRPGGYQYRSPELLTTFEPEHTSSWEISYNTKWDNVLTFKAALFYTDITDHRINTFTDTLASVVLTADKAYSCGFEAELTYRNENIELTSSVGRTIARYREFSDDTLNIYEGNTLLEVPDITAALGIRYELDPNFYIVSSLRHMGERYYDIGNTAKADPYTVVNLTLGYKKARWSAELYATNILDKEYVDFMIHTPTNDYYHFGAPEVVGIKLKTSF